jgi:hypothetical protein
MDINDNPSISALSPRSVSSALSPNMTSSGVLTDDGLAAQRWYADEVLRHLKSVRRGISNAQNDVDNLIGLIEMDVRAESDEHAGTGGCISDQSFRDFHAVCGSGGDLGSNDTRPVAQIMQKALVSLNALNMLACARAGTSLPF